MGSWSGRYPATGRSPSTHCTHGPSSISCLVGLGALNTQRALRQTFASLANWGGTSAATMRPALRGGGGAVTQPTKPDPHLRHYPSSPTPSPPNNRPTPTHAQHPPLLLSAMRVGRQQWVGQMWDKVGTGGVQGVGPIHGSVRGGKKGWCAIKAEGYGGGGLALL